MEKQLIILKATSYLVYPPNQLIFEVALDSSEKCDWVAESQ